MSTYPNLKWARVTAGASVGTAWANELQTGIWAIQFDMWQAKDQVSTLASYVNILIGTSGGLVTGSSHDTLLGITASLHHAKSHAITHINTGGNWAETATLSPATSRRPYYSYNWGGSEAIYAGQYAGGNSYRIISSIDGGISWDVEKQFTGAAGNPTSFIDDGAGVLICALMGGEIYTKTGVSASWTVETDLNVVWPKLGVHSGYVYAGGGGVVYRRAVGGGAGDWELCGQVTGVAKSMKVFGSYLYLASTGYDGKVYVYRNIGTGANIFVEVDNESEEFAYELDTFGSDLYLSTGSTGKLFKTSDGTSWSTAATISANYYIATIEEFGDYFFAAGYASGSSDRDIFRSDDGTTWVRVEDDIGSSNIPWVLFQHKGSLFLGTWYKLFVYRPRSTTEYAVATQAGLMPAAKAIILDTLATQATLDQWSVSGHYTGDGGAVVTEAIGFRPAWVTVQEASAVHNVWEAFDTATYAFQHKAGGLGHARPKASESIKILNDGFAAWGAATLNKTGVTYFYTAIKES